MLDATTAAAPPTNARPIDASRELRVCWAGDNPVPGQWLASATGRTVYRIVTVRVLHHAVLSPKPRLALRVYAMRRTAMPEDKAGQLMPWSRTAAPDAPSAAPLTGSEAAKPPPALKVPADRRKLAKRPLHADKVPDAMLDIEHPGAVTVARWRDPASTGKIVGEVTGYRRACVLRHMAKHAGSQITVDHIIAAERVRTAAEIATVGLSGGNGLNSAMMGGCGGAAGPSSGPSAIAVKQADACDELRQVYQRVGIILGSMLTVIVIGNRSISGWCKDSAAKGRPLDRKVETGRLISLLDLLAEHYGDHIRLARARGDLPV